MDWPVHEAVEAAARNSRAQLLSFIAARAAGDLASAEDALSEAFLAALEQWPEAGVPANPEAWLATVARRRLTDLQRRSRTREEAQEAIQHALELAETSGAAGEDFPDERLKLLFVCAHPAIDPAARTPLMLQTILALSAERIASAFLAAPAAMSQRLVRAKTRIRAAGIPFSIPEKREWNERLGCVLDAIYVAYTTGRDDPEGTPTGLAVEALRLARLVTELLPGEPEPLGLLALILHGEARRDARVVAGEYVPLPLQDVARWDRAMIAEAEAALREAAERQTLGRFQIEAAIQSIHAARAVTGETNWAAIASFYTVLLQHTPALGARVGQAIAIGKVEGPAAALALLEAMPREPVASYQPWWAARAALLAELQRKPEALAAYDQAIGLCIDAAPRCFLLQRQAALRSTDARAE